MEEKLYVVNENELRRLVKAEAILNALEAGGVDNWNYYGESIHEALNGTGYESVSEFVDGELMSEYTSMQDWFKEQCEAEDKKDSLKAIEDTIDF